MMQSLKDILICIKTYPEYSSKYTETVCTAGILKESRRLVRLYPIAYRYLEGTRQFQKYQWIKARIEKNLQDDRPESYKIANNSISLESVIDTANNWGERKQWVMYPENVYESIEALGAAQSRQGTSLGIIKPKDIVHFTINQKTKEEIKEAESKKYQIMQQQELLREKKDLEIIPVRFTLHFICNDTNCTKPHKISILDWEFAELYRKECGRLGWEAKIKQKIDQLCAKDRDTHLFMGNMRGHPQTFCILGFFWPKREPEKVIQRSLFS